MFEILESNFMELMTWINHVTNGNEIAGAGVLAFITGLVTYWIPRTILMVFRKIRREYSFTVKLTEERVEGKFPQGRIGDVMTFIFSQTDPKNIRTRILKFNMGRLKAKPGYGLHILRYRGKWLSARYKTEVNGDQPREVLELFYLGRNPGFLEQIVEDYNTACENNKDRFVRRPGANERRSASVIPKYMPGSLIVDPVVVDVVERAIRKFRENRDLYLKCGVPWKISILLHGEPGTGKTTIVRRMAQIFESNIYAVNLESDGIEAVVSAIDSSRKGDIILIEDVDTSDSTLRRLESGETDEKTKPKGLGTLLNTLGGIDTLDGVIVFMTTNHKDKLDPALVRSGRVDVDFEVPLLRPELIKEHMEKLFGDRIVFPDNFVSNMPAIPACKVNDALQRHMFTPEKMPDYLYETYVQDGSSNR